VEMAVEGSSLCVVSVRAVTGRQKPHLVSGMTQLRQYGFSVMASLVASAKGFWKRSEKVSQTLRSGLLFLQRHSVGRMGLLNVLVWCRCRRYRD
jgi:hypothetical protein